jgi:hypothetical protein
MPPILTTRPGGRRVHHPGELEAKPFSHAFLYSNETTRDLGTLGSDPSSLWRIVLTITVKSSAPRLDTPFSTVMEKCGILAHWGAIQQSELSQQPWRSGSILRDRQRWSSRVSLSGLSNARSQHPDNPKFGSAISQCY